jgi:MFS family permease
MQSTTEQTKGEFSAASAVVVALSILMVGFGLLMSLLGVRGTQEFSTTVVGIAGSVHYAGFLAGAIIAPRLVGSVGHIRVYAALASAGAVVALLFPFLVHPVAWISIRLILGLSISGMYVVAESWLNSVSTNATRGKVLAAYLVTVNLAVGLGQGLLAVTGTAGFLPFVVGSALFSASVIPLSLTRTPAPSHAVAHASPPVRHVMRSAPLGPITSVVSGISVGVAIGMGPTYGVLSGMSVRQVALLMAVGMVGGILLQWPIGALSDRFPRRRVILTTAALAGFVALGGLAVAPRSIGVYVVFGTFTAVSFPLYSLAISHVNDVISPDLRVAASAVMVMAYGLGSVAGPFVTSFALNAEGQRGFWMMMALSTLVLLPYGIYRLIKRPSITHRVRHRPLPPEPIATPSILWTNEDR